MFLRQSARPLRLATVCLACAAALPDGAPRAQTQTMFGTVTVDKPPATTDGDWKGTWYYVSRMRRMALWLREDNGVPQLMLQIQGKGTGEALLTGWDGSVAYDLGGVPGAFRLTFTRRDADAIEGTWSWEWGNSVDGWRETADFSAYRSGDGRQLVWVMKNLEEQHWGTSEYALTQPEVAWIFQKASRREALWGELPF